MPRQEHSRPFNETLQVRIRKDRKYREQLLREGVECPQARNLFEVIGQLQRIEGLHFEVSRRATS